MQKQKLRKSGVNKMWSDNITVCIMVHNEEKRIEYAIKNFLDKFNILVIDDIPPSTDRTSDICKKYGVEYIQIDKHGFIEQPVVMNEVWKHVKTDYMLMARCAEYFPDELLSLYAKVVNQKNYDVVCSARVSITAGKHILVWGNPKKNLKTLISPCLMKRGSIDYENNLIHHEGRIVCEKDRILKPSKDIHLMHYQFRDYDASWSEVKHAQYNDVNAVQFHQKGERYSFFKMIFTSLKFFFIEYFYHGAYKQGHLGFMHAYYRFHLFMGIYLRLWDIEHNLQKNQITDLHNSMRSRLLSKEIDVDSLFN
jgi:glycosyltransferase involved in cell wall biosynthesis